MLNFDPGKYVHIVSSLDLFWLIVGYLRVQVHPRVVEWARACGAMPRVLAREENSDDEYWSQVDPDGYEF